MTGAIWELVLENCRLKPKSLLLARNEGCALDIEDSEEASVRIKARYLGILIAKGEDLFMSL